MNSADRAFSGMVTIAVLVGTLLAVPVALTLFPAVFERIGRGSSDVLLFCDGVITSLHNELPPLGAASLALAAASLVPVSLRAVRVVRSARRDARPLRLVTSHRLRRAAARAGVAQHVICVDDRARYAFCAGLARPRIFVSLGAVKALSHRELEAVLWHEGHHLQRRDPLRAWTARILAAAFFATPIVRELADRFETAKELEADRAALVAQGTPRELAGAMLVLGRPRAVPGWAPMSAWSRSSARIDQLAGLSPDRLLPGLSRRAVALTATALLIACVLALGQAARAHLLPLGFLPEPPGAAAHVCPLPLAGPLL